MRYSELWGWEGTIGRVAYAATGLTALALKCLLDWYLVEFQFERDWSLPAYWYSPFGSIAPYDMQWEHDGQRAALLGLGLPFVWLGVVLTLRRLRSIGWPRWLVVLFFVPYLNLSFFLLLSLTPPAARSTRRTPRFRWRGADRSLSSGSAAAAAALLANLIAAPLILLAIFVDEQFGWGVFVSLPFLIGLATALLDLPPGSGSLGRSILVSTGSVFLAGAWFLLLGVEGLICIFMALPLTAPLAWLGAAVGFRMGRRTPEAAVSFHVLPVFLLTLPAMFWLEKVQLRDPPVYSVSSAVEIEAPPSIVWDHVVSIEEIPPPEGWMFRSGIAYPSHVEIDGTGPGATWLSVFSTGAFVGSVEVWDEPRLLQFEVTSTPAPLTELTPYGELQLPHVDGFFVTEGGQFLLEPLGADGTRLVGTTWYRHGLWPAFYWRWWSDALIDRIHLRVLDHIGRLAEAEGRPSASGS